MATKPHYSKPIKTLCSVMAVGICGWLTASYTYYTQSLESETASTKIPVKEEISDVGPTQDLVTSPEDKQLAILNALRQEQDLLLKQLEKSRQEYEKRAQEDAIILPGTEIRPLSIPQFIDPSTDYLPPPIESHGSATNKPADYPF